MWIAEFLLLLLCTRASDAWGQKDTLNTSICLATK